MNIPAAQASEEFENFRMEESYFSQGGFYRMGPGSTAYTIESVRPIITQVSPLAEDKLQTAMKLGEARLIIAAVSLASILGAYSTDEGPTRDALFTAGTVGAISTFVIGFIQPAYMASSARQFNQDLKQKLNLGVGATYQF